MLADISGLVGFIVFVAIAIVSSLLKRKQEGEFELPPELKPRRDQPPAPPRPAARSWEEQLRQLLEEQPAPPPVIQERPAPPPIRPVFRAPVVEAPEPHIQVSLPPPRPNVEPAFQRLAGLTQSDAGYAQAAQLQQRVARHLADVTRLPVGSTSVKRGPVPPQVRDVWTAVRDRDGIRRAMLASIVLGPPRAFEI